MGWFLLQDELILHAGTGSCRWELTTDEEDLQFAEAVIQAAVDGQARETLAPGRSRIAVHLRDGREEVTAAADGLAGLIPGRWWFRGRRDEQFEPYAALLPVTSPAAQSLPVAPLVLFEGQDAQPVDVLFCGVREVDRVVEAIDVENGEYLCFDGLARPVTLQVIDDRVSAELSPEAGGIDAVRGRMLSWAAASGLEASMPPPPTDTEDLEDVHRWLREVQDVLSSGPGRRDR